MKRRFLVVFSLTLLSLAAAVYGHMEDEGVSESSIDYILATSAISGFLVIFSILYKNKGEGLKIILFLGIIIPIIITTAQIVASTISLNTESETGGPVHWHADFEIWSCGEGLGLVEPKGLSNRVGTSVFHEHDDNRMHIEGVVKEREKISLHRFFEVVGGELTEAVLAVPTNDGIMTVENGDKCPDGTQGKVQVFLYKVTNPEAAKNWEFGQEKLESYEDYVISPYSNVPPGDCMVIEFSKESNKTAHICKSYELAIERGELTGS